ncbi:MAG: elongation factor 1-beta, partial [Candidatus Bathyarchaeia archaeon]
MGKVFVSMKVFPSDININLNELKERIKQSLPKSSSIRKIEEEPIAFGLSALILHLVIPEEEAGVMDTLELRIKGVEGV